MLFHVKAAKLSKKSLCALLFAVPLLTACADQGPWPMPTGYTYLNAQYKAPPGAEPTFRKWQTDREASAAMASPAMTAEIETSTAVIPVTSSASAPAGSMDQAAQDLIGRLATDFGQPSEPVFIQADGPPSPGFEKALAVAMRGQRMHLAAAPGEGPFVLHYSVKGAAGRSLVTITLTSAGQQAAMESGSYGDFGFDASSSATHVSPPAPIPMMVPPVLKPPPAAPMPLLPQGDLND